MQPDELLNIIRQPQNIASDEVKEIRKLLHKYPYFQLACTLVAKALYDHNPDKAKQAIQLAAVYATDRNHLKALLEDKLGYTEPIKEQPIDKTEQKYDYNITTSVCNEHSIDFINSYISNICTKKEKRITKKKSLEQLNIIENFIKQGGKFKLMTIKQMSLQESHIDLTKESIILHDNLLTENLAHVMLKQGKFDKAIDIYRRLQLKYPEKGSYFSALSEDLKKDI